ncbi:MAG: hypothetical protein NC110_06650 [Ruminococcus sp.]|nr:hypothetical protein [Ruminococcus sp.]
MTRTIETCLVGGLERALKKYKCKVVRGNQTAPKLPPFPYISYISTTPILSNAKGWSEESDGSLHRQMSQILSFTVHSDDQEQADAVLLDAFKWFDATGRLYLSDNDIHVERILNVSNRDDLISIDYEYKRGFDVQFSVMQDIEAEQMESQETIEYIEFIK